MIKRLFVVAALMLLWACTLRAQTTYPMDKTPFVCNAVTMVSIEMPFGDFNCRGVFYNSGDIELFFNGGSGSLQVSSKSGGWLAYGKLTETSFTQSNPYSCPVKMPGYITGCPAGTIPGTFSFTWSATDANKVVHTGSVSGTWENIQYCGGERCWYHPTLETAPLTLN